MERNRVHEIFVFKINTVVENIIDNILSTVENNNDCVLIEYNNIRVYKKGRLFIIFIRFE